MNNQLAGILAAMTLFVVAFPSASQSLIFSGDTVTLKSCDLLPNSIDTISVYNATEENIVIHWEVVDYYSPHAGYYWLIVDPYQYLPSHHQGNVPMQALDTTDIIFYMSHDTLFQGDTVFLQIHVYNEAEGPGTGQILTAIQYCPWTTGIVELRPEPQIQVYPNPVHDMATIRLPDVFQPASLRLMSITGEIIRDVPVTDSEMKLTTAGLPAGIYFLSMVNARQVIASTRMVLLD